MPDHFIIWPAVFTVNSHLKEDGFLQAIANLECFVLDCQYGKGGFSDWKPKNYYVTLFNVLLLDIRW